MFEGTPKEHMLSPFLIHLLADVLLLTFFTKSLSPLPSRLIGVTGILTGVYLIFLVNQSAGQVKRKSYKPLCTFTSPAIESQ